MESKDETIIEMSRAKTARLLLAACAFVAAGVWLLSYDAAEIRNGRSFGFFYNEPLLVRGVGFASVVFFGLCGLYAVKRLFDRKPGLVLDASGILDNASGASAGFIPWADVVGSHVLQIQSQKMLVVEVREPGKYLDRGNALRRALNKANAKVGGGPITIPATTLAIDFTELLSLFDRYLQKYGGAPRDADAHRPTPAQDAR
ncbi:MAG TPA: STM3941 family protein [Pyrinomonadaceae bacterium]